MTEVPTPTTVAILPFKVMTDVSADENVKVPVNRRNTYGFERENGAAPKALETFAVENLGDTFATVTVMVVVAML